jgi:hypothetical protein
VKRLPKQSCGELSRACSKRGATRMPKGPKGEKRPADVIGNAVRVMEIGTGQAEETIVEKNPHAVARVSWVARMAAKFAPKYSPQKHVSASPLMQRMLDGRIGLKADPRRS